MRFHSLDLSIEGVQWDFTLKALVIITMPVLRLLCLLQYYVSTMPTTIYYACTIPIYNYCGIGHVGVMLNLIPTEFTGAIIANSFWG